MFNAGNYKQSYGVNELDWNEFLSSQVMSLLLFFYPCSPSLQSLPKQVEGSIHVYSQDLQMNPRGKNTAFLFISN